MNVSAVLTAVALTTVVASSAANASVASSRAFGGMAATSPVVSRVDFVQGHEAISSIPAQQAFVRAEASRNSSERYFDFDVLVTAGALAIASGAFLAGAIGRGRRESLVAQLPTADWRETVMRNLDADLTQFSEGLRRAA